jgi:hypothetical protein
MPFEQITPREFTLGGVKTYAPEVSGVYGISNARQWIYIGVTDNIRVSLLGHLQEPATSVMQCVPTGFVYEACEQGRRSSRQDRLILEYEPACNRLIREHSTSSGRKAF